MTDSKEEIKLTPEEIQKELQGRVEQFNKELIPLLGKYELGLGASAFLQLDGTIAARPIMFDARKKEEDKKVAEGGDVGAVAEKKPGLEEA